MMQVKNKKQHTNNVMFHTSKDQIIPNSSFYEQRKKDDVKHLWYTREELMASCNEAKKIVKLIQLVGCKLEDIDHTVHCVVGLETYHGKNKREKYQNMLIQSVLIHQDMNQG
jgi:hypothetical protein